MDRSTGATAGLFFAWLAHDIEELFTMRDTSRRLFRVLPESVPLPADWRENGVPQSEITLAITTMGLLMAAASADGYRTGGRSAFYQTALLGFGLHGIGHLGMAAAMRGYAAGVATAPTVVIPFWLWATRHLDSKGVPPKRSVRGAALLILGSIWGAQGLANAVARRRDQNVRANTKVRVKPKTVPYGSGG